MAEPQWRTNRKDWVFLLGLFLAAVVIHGLIGGFTRQLTIYMDEMYYYSIADSLWAGRGVTVQGEAVAFQKIGYSLLLAPLFRVHNTVLRVRLIGWLNSVLLMSSVFPVWLTGRELGLHKRTCRLLTAAVCLVPESLLTATFMAENLYYSLVFWCVWLWLAAGRTGRWRVSLPGGVAGCLAYTVKEAFLALAASFILLDLIRVIRTWRTDRNAAKARLICLLTYAFSLFGLLAVIRFTVFSSMDYSYGKQVSTAVLADPVAVKTMIWTVLTYTVFTLCTVFVFPFSFSLAVGPRLDEQARRFIRMILLYVVITVVFIAFTISVYDDLGRPDPRFHLRYYAPAILLTLMGFAVCVQRRTAEDGKRIFRRAAILSAGALLAVILVYRGVRADCVVDHFTLSWTHSAHQLAEDMGLPSADIWLMIGIQAIVVLTCLLLLRRGKRRIAALVCAGIFAVAAAADWAYLIPRMRKDYQADPALIESVQAVGRTLADAPEDATLLILSDSGTDPVVRRCIDTYLDVPCRVEAPRYVKRPRNGEEQEVELLGGRAEYLLVGGKTLASRYDFPDCEPVEPWTEGELLLFRCRTPERIVFTASETSTQPQALRRDQPVRILFYGGGYNADLYVRKGISSPEANFSWTEGHEITFEIPAAETFRTIGVSLDIGETFNGAQPLEVWRGGDVAYSAEVTGPCTLRFDLQPDDETLTFLIRLPEAIEVSQVYAGSDDIRCVALQLLEMTLWAAE